MKMCPDPCPRSFDNAKVIVRKIMLFLSKPHLRNKEIITYYQLSYKIKDLYLTQLKGNFWHEDE